MPHHDVDTCTAVKHRNRLVLLLPQVPDWVGTLLCKVGGCVRAAFLQKILFLNTPGLIVSKDTPWWDYRAV